MTVTIDLTQDETSSFVSKETLLSSITTSSTVSMARTQTTSEMSDFEKQRLANIAERDALLKKLTLEAQSSGLYSKPAAPKSSSDPHKKKKPATKKIKDETPQPRRTSSRLAGITPDSEVAKRKAEDEYEAAKEHERVKRQRISGDLALGDIVVVGKGLEKGFLGNLEGVTKGVARPYERTFGDEEVKATGDMELKALREKMNGLALWEPWIPNRIKITPERIYSMTMHPTISKPLVFAGDKLGNLGLFDASQTRPEVKEEDEDDDDEPDPIITTLKPHARTISAMRTHHSTPHTLYTASYDSSIRSLDLEKMVSTELFAASNDDPISGVDFAADDSNVLYFSTLNGVFGRHDIRTADQDYTCQLSEKKIGGFSLHPRAPHYVATASLDKSMRIWDLRMIKKKMPELVGEHQSRVSVSHAAFNAVGQVATTSYDDSIKIFDFEGMDKWKQGKKIYQEDELKPDTVVRHNCQTGRWVTILKPHWQAHPRDSVQRLCIGNMNRFVDIYSSKGEQLAQLGGEGITAVPAVAVFHQSEDWVAAGTASGKLCLWM